MLHQIGGELLETKLRNPVSHVKYEDGMYEEFPHGALVIVDWRLADLLADATIRAIQAPSSGSGF